MSSILETEYWSTAADESLPLSLSLSPSGAAKLWVRSNRDDTRRTVVGFFEGTIPLKPIADVFSAVGSPGFAGIPNPASVVPGEVVRKITTKPATGTAVVKFVGEETPAPPAFADAEAAILRSVEEASKFPSLAIGFRLDALPGELTSGHELRFDLHVSNPGRHTLIFPVPESWAGSGTVVTGKGLRTDIPLAKLNNSHSPEAAIGPANIGPSAPASPDGKLRLDPGRSLRFPIKVRLPWEPGTYGFQVFLESTLRDAQGKDFTRFEWVSLKSKLEVKQP